MKVHRCINVFRSNVSFSRNYNDILILWGFFIEMLMQRELFWFVFSHSTLCRALITQRRNLSSATGGDISCESKVLLS